MPWNPIQLILFSEVSLLRCTFYSLYNFNSLEVSDVIFIAYDNIGQNDILKRSSYFLYIHMYLFVCFVLLLRFAASFGPLTI